MGTYKIFASSAVVVIYLVTFTVWQIQFATRQQLFNWLISEQSQNLYPALDASGIWSVEDVATRSFSSLPDHITADRKVFSIYKYLKDQARVNITLPLWLRDQGLDNYANIKDNVDLVRLSHKYPGEIFYTIQQLKHLSPAERSSLRKDVHDFKSAVGNFVGIDKKSGIVKAHKKRYEKSMLSWLWRYGPNRIESLKVNTIQWIYTTSFIAVSMLVLWLAIPNGLPLHGSTVLPLLCTYWFIPEWGKLNIFSMLFIRSFKEPARMVLFSGILYIWTMAANDGIHSHLILLFSIIPTIFFLICIHSLRCQPSVIQEKASDLYDLTVSGIGYLDNEIESFVRSKKVSWLYKKLAAAESLDKLEWDKIQRIKFEEVDVPWKTIQEIIEPSIKSGSLKVIWLADNYAISDNDAGSMGKLAKETKSLDTLRITYNRRPSLLDLLYRLLLWNQNPVRFTNDGALSILDILADTKSEKSHLKTLDFCGVHLKQSFVKKIKDTSILKSINILVNKRMVTDTKPTSEIISYISNKTCLLCALIYTTIGFYKIIHPSEINIAFDTWTIQTFQESIYPHLENFLQPYIQNLSFPGSLLESSY